MNPIAPGAGVADPHIKIFNGKPYMFATRDKDPDSEKFIMPDWHVWTTDDLVTWKLAKTIYPTETYFPKENYTRCWASDGAERNGKYYMYISECQTSTGVMVADSPVGDYHDPLGKPLMKGLLQSNHPYDPSVFIDDDPGQTPYIVVGLYLPPDRDPENKYNWGIARLGEDMISLVPDSFREIEILGDSPGNDKPTLHKHQGIYYLSAGSFYLTSEDVYGPYTFRGWSAKNHTYGLTGQAHGNYFEWNGQWFHVWCHFVRGSNVARFRDSRMTYLHYRDNGDMVDDLLLLDKHFEDGVGQYSALWDRIEAEWYMTCKGIEKREKTDQVTSDAEHALSDFEIRNIGDGGYLSYPNIRDVPENAEIIFHYLPANDGTIEVHRDAHDGPLLGECTVAATEGDPSGDTRMYRDQTCNLRNEPGTLNLFLVFKGEESDICCLDHFRFSP